MARRIGLAGALTLAMSVLFVSTASATPKATAQAPVPGYWLAGGDGGVYSFNAPFFGSAFAPNSPAACSFSPQPPSNLNGRLGCSAIAAIPMGPGTGCTMRSGPRRHSATRN